MDLPLPTSPFLDLSFSSLFLDGVNKLDFLRLFLDVVGVELGVGKSLFSRGVERASMMLGAGVVAGGGGGAIKGAAVVTAPGALTRLNPSSRNESVRVMPVSSAPLPW